MNFKTLLFLSTIFATPLYTFAQYTGKVFEDKNNNQIYDRGDLALANVLVSDGLAVVKTAKDGTFTLPGHAKERFVFITTPSGYKTNNKHYLPIDKNTAAYAFALQRYDGGIQKSGAHKYVHVTDTEIFNTEKQEDWVDNVRQYAANEGNAFIVHTGDICYENGLKNHIKLMNTKNMDCPVFYCIGNHDLVDGKYGEALFESLYGPVFYSFEVGNVHYIVTPMLGGDRAPSYKKEDVYRWLKNDLAHVGKDKSIVVFNHDLLTTKDQFIYGISDTEQINLNDHNLKAWVYGHWHINYMRKQGDVYSVSSSTVDKGGIDHSTSSFRVMHVDKAGDFTSEVRYSYIDKSLQIAAPALGHMAATAEGNVPLSVNVYNSESPAAQVSFVYAVNGKAWSKPKQLVALTDWNWEAAIPANKLKAHDEVQLIVSVQYGNGEVQKQRKKFVFDAQPTPISLGSDWNNLLGNAQHIGLTDATFAAPQQLAWSTNVKGNIYMNSPLIANNKIYVATVDENLQGNAFIQALDAQTGALCWKYTVRNSIKNSLAITDGIVFAQDADGYLYAVDANTGKLVWEKKLSTNPLPAVIEGVVATEGIIYAGTGKGLTAVDAKTGKSHWTNTAWGQAEGTTSTPSVGNGVLVTGSQWRGLYAHDVATGKLLWSKSKDGLSDRGASAAIHGDLVYITSRTSLFVLDLHTGKTIVRKALPYKVDVTSTPLVTEKAIIFGTFAAGLVAVDRETFEPLWQFELPAALVYTAPYTRSAASTVETSPVLVGSTVYVAASDGAVYGVDCVTGKAVWKHETGAPMFSTVAVSGNMLVAADFAGNVYAFTGVQEE